MSRLSASTAWTDLSLVPMRPATLYAITLTLPATPLTHQWEGDTLGRVIRYLDPEGSATAFTYTRQDQIASVTFADGSRWQRSYQPGSASMLERETTGAGTEVNYE